ncbi:MAG: hypothetical protein Q4P11_05595 [Methanobrevibacter sp.]|nr:hypothetical protein [Methanobrevibacter sp.]
MNDDFEGNDYGFNDFKENDDFSNDFNAYDSKLVDIRIILTNMDYLEYISKAVSNFDLSNFNVNISSIIPTDDIEIAKNTIVGADLVLIATSNNEKGHKLYQNFKKSLKNDFNFIEYLKLPSLEDLNDYGYDEYNDDNVFEDEIANSIIRGGLFSISNLSSINDSKRKYEELKKEFEEESLKYDKINKENELLIRESKSLREKNEKLYEEVKVLQRELDKIKSDYSDLKSRFEGLYSKNSLEVYSLNDLWYDLFGEYLSQEVYKFILISTDNFRPKNLMIGQGAICAESKEDALDWLKIIKTAFILSDTNKQDLDYNNFKSNFKFEEFGVDSAFQESGNLNGSDLGESSVFNNLDDSLFERSFLGNDEDNKEEDVFDSPTDDEFIYNARFEGNDVSRNESYVDDDKSEDTEKINVFNLKSLKSMEDDEDDSSLEDEINSYDSSSDDYDYDEEDIDENDDEEIYNAFSNLWG